METDFIVFWTNLAARGYLDFDSAFSEFHQDQNPGFISPNVRIVESQPKEAREVFNRHATPYASVQGVEVPRSLIRHSRGF